MKKSITKLVTTVMAAFLLMAPSLAHGYNLNNQSIIKANGGAGSGDNAYVPLSRFGYSSNKQDAIEAFSGAGSGDVHFPW
ncbi:hypothetical protein L5D93_11945 [Paenibacillus thiaminolyticus]|nr:hypothetical protein [Paenibacillus thiaminolyticus]